jgi:hypothetical protein
VTTLTIAGTITDRDGLAVQRSIGWDGHRATETRSFTSYQAKEFRATQARDLPVNIEHDDIEIGEVVHLEEHGGSIVAVAVVNGARCVELLKPSSAPRYWSAEFTHRGGRDIALTGLAIVAQPAIRGLRPLQVHLDDVREIGWRSRQSFLNPDRLLERAAVAHRRRRFRDPIVIADHDDPPEQLLERAAITRRSSGRTMVLPDGSVADVEHTPPHYNVISVR